MNRDSTSFNRHPAATRGASHTRYSAGQRMEDRAGVAFEDSDTSATQSGARTLGFDAELSNWAWHNAA